MRPVGCLLAAVGIAACSCRAGGSVFSLVTSSNRRVHDPSGESISGGWGPHLRAPLQTPDGRLWFPVDGGGRAHERVSYVAWDGRSWREMGVQAHAAALKQNMAHILRGSTIFSYGVAPGVLVECRFDAVRARRAGTGPVRVGGTPVRPAAGSQYVGAAVSSTGLRVVWWSTVGSGFSYVFNRSLDADGWEGPVTTPYPDDATSFGYAFAHVDGDRLLLFGELYAGSYPAGTYWSAVTEFAVGAPSAGFRRLAPTRLGAASQDLWADSSAIALALVKTDEGLACWIRRAHGDWSEAPAGRLAGRFIGRFLPSRRGLRMVSADLAGRLFVRDAPASGAIGLTGAGEREIVPPDADLLPPSAMYAGATAGGDLMICGRYPEHDHEIWHVRLEAP